MFCYSCTATVLSSLTDPTCENTVLHVQQTYDGPVYDRSDNRVDVRTNNAVTFDSTQDPVFNSGSLSFDSSQNSYLSIQQTPFLTENVFNIQQDDFTLEMWFMTRTTGVRQGLISTHDSINLGSPGIDAFDVEIRTSNNLLIHFRKPDNSAVNFITNTPIQAPT